MYDVIHDALKVICNKNLKHSRNFDDMSSDRNKAHNRKIAYYLRSFRQYWASDNCMATAPIYIPTVLI